ncbi:MAG TPA: TerC family protein [Gammaproteobacteria bacterium]|jgi:predicted tellurium resistance membrane protein TerC|nr:TerC family protein [Gammaproteobacteria bacterium]
MDTLHFEMEYGMEVIDIIASLLTLTVLEILLGIDNLIFLTLLSQRLPQEKRAKACQIGLSLAWMTRLLLLSTALIITKLNQPLFSFNDFSFSFRDLFLILGGLFLLAKSTQEIHHELEPEKQEATVKLKFPSFRSVVLQIAILDIIFSLDSVLTAVGLTQSFLIMASAITIAILCMIFASRTLNRFLEKHPTLKMLALVFLILIGTVLVADGFGYHLPRAYIYFAMAFSLSVEGLNIIKRERQ